MSLVLSDLNKKVKDTENEKLSLVTALKILYEEQKRTPQDKDQIHTHANLGKQTNNNGEQTYSTVGKNKSSKKIQLSPKITKEVINLDSTTSDQSYIVATRNRYEVLGNELPNGNNDNNSGMSSLNYEEDQYNTAEQQSETTQTSKAMRPKTSREVSTNEDQTKASTETSPRTYNSGNQPRRTINVAVAGDSMLKYINPSKLSKSLKQNVHVKTFPGAKVADMEHYVKPTLAHAPEYLVLHVGTNDLRQKSPRQIATSITKLGHEINANMPNTKLILSEVIVRNDDPQLMIKVKEVNSKLSQVCLSNRWDFLTHGNILVKHLNPYGVHLNKQGTSILAKNLSDFLKLKY